mmetsp:Transcript_31175/g.100025  ORF Transcript_31175/g.100025 Transcript_31175/m.100025 type:complete len:205 (-) Transcript_31175:28-642(-)
MSPSAFSPSSRVRNRGLNPLINPADMGKSKLAPIPPNNLRRLFSVQASDDEPVTEDPREPKMLLNEGGRPDIVAVDKVTSEFFSDFFALLLVSDFVSASFPASLLLVTSLLFLVTLGRLISSSAAGEECDAVEDLVLFPSELSWVSCRLSRREGVEVSVTSPSLSTFLRRVDLGTSGGTSVCLFRVGLPRRSLDPSSISPAQES